MSGFAVLIEELTQAATKIDGAADLADGITVDEAADGGAAAAGNDEVATALSEFCDTWNLAKGILQQRARAAADGLTSAATDYERMEENARTTVEGGGHG